MREHSYIHFARPGAAGGTTSELGGKGAQLTALVAMDLPVPPFAVVTTRAFDETVATPSFRKMLDAALAVEDPKRASETVAAWFEEAPLAPGLVEELSSCREALGGGPLAVRSSATLEDGRQRSFAGMLSTFLFVRETDQLVAGVRGCFTSLFSARALTYAREHGLDLTRQSVAVVVQQMVDADAAGVLFTADPVTDDRGTMILDAVPGLGEGLVCGLLDPDHFEIDRETLETTRERLVHKPTMLAFDERTGHGITEVPVAEERRDAPVIDASIRRRLAEIGNLLAERLGREQDVEWAVAGSDLFLLQARPITGLAPNTNVLIWDNSNITESYGGLTLPLTFSVVRHYYYESFRASLADFGVSQEVLARIDPELRNLLGLIEGRVYYNLLHWYTMVFQLPAVRQYKPIWEKMLGVRESLPEWAKDGFSFSVDAPSLDDRWTKWKLAVKNGVRYMGFQREVDAFVERMDRLHAEHDAVDYDGLDFVELIRRYRELEDLLLRRWKEPNFNDVFGFFSFGLLANLSRRWFGEETTVHNDLVAGGTSIISMEPARRLAAIAELVDGAPAMEAALELSDSDAALRRIRTAPELEALREAIDGYIADFGFRTMDELKFECPDLNTNPELIIVMLRNALRGRRAGGGERSPGVRESIQREATETVRKTLGPARRRLYHLLLAHARRGLRNRENTRFLRSKMYGLVRRIFHAAGRRLAEMSVIEAPGDVFYLTRDELFALIDGASFTHDYRHLVELRKETYRSYEQSRPADRIVTRGMVYHHNRLDRRDTPKPAGSSLRGIGASSGTVTGPVKVIRSAADNLDLNGEILATERTDPGWVTLYPSISGLIVERGSLVSHSIIVAREMGIPTVVGVERLTDILSDGERVTIDGQAGTVTRLPDETQPRDE